MSTNLEPGQVNAVTMLLEAGKTIKEIAKFAELDSDAVTRVARDLDLEPAGEVERRAKVLYGSTEGLTFQEVAQRLAEDGFTSDDGGPMHHLTVASWVKNHGWAWGGADDGDYAPERTTAPAARSKYSLRLSKALDAEINTASKLQAAADAAWDELRNDNTHIVQLAVIRGAGAAGVTNLGEVKKLLLATHGDTLRTATR